MLFPGYLKPARPTAGNAGAALTIPNHEDEHISAETSIQEVTTYQNCILSTNLFWTLMLYPGYLKPARPTAGNAGAALTIPNHEDEHISASRLNYGLIMLY